MMTSNSETEPSITLTAQGYESLSLLTRSAAKRMPDVASVLAEELERAHVHNPFAGSVVELRDDTTRKVQICGR